ncbi:hypothetical protein pb186bvf_011622 [Paramecium bursaria]
MQQQSEDDFRQKWGHGIIERYQKNKTQLQTGQNLKVLGFLKNDKGTSRFQYQFQNWHENLISVFLEDNSSCIDPIKNMPQINSSKWKVDKRKEFANNFNDETLIYMFYNVIDEKQQAIAADYLYQRGWMYNSKNDQWFKDLIQIGANRFQGKYFSIQNWKLTDISSIELQENEFVKREEFAQYL